jgi:hypothetical protein
MLFVTDVEALSKSVAVTGAVETGVATAGDAVEEAEEVEEVVLADTLGAATGELTEIFADSLLF